MSDSKKFGLILPEKSKQQPPVFQASRNIFGNDSESEDENKKINFLARPSHIVNRQAKVTQEKAVKEDPTVYQYDEIYDTMNNKKEKEKIKTKEERKPRYIEKLLKTAQKRKLENERRIERQVQKEREKEGDEFADKEVFVTSAYKKKLEELRLEEEREKREEYLESIGDVTKQKDLGGFYRHLYEQKLGGDKDEDHKDEKRSIIENVELKCAHDAENTSKILKQRNYRKRKSSDHTAKQLSEGEIEESDEEIVRMNLRDIKEAKISKQNEENIDADSDFIDDESSDDELNDTKKEGKESTKEKNKPINENKSTPETLSDKSVSITLKPETTLVEQEPPKVKIDIWKKRTVGEVFDQALQRYYQRKAARGS